MELTTARARSERRQFKIIDLLRPHRKALAIGIVAVIGEGVANLLEPWPLKVVLDHVLKSAGHGWLNDLILSTVGEDPLDILKLAAVAVLTIAVIGAICSYTEKYVTTSIGQWVTHDLRRTLYSHIQRLSLAYHEMNPVRAAISRRISGRSAGGIRAATSARSAFSDAGSSSSSRGLQTANFCSVSPQTPN